MPNIRMVHAVIEYMDFDIQHMDVAEVEDKINDMCINTYCADTPCKDCPYCNVDNYKLFNATLKELINERN